MKLKKNNKGFTMAELLIVVAIIAVLVAIAIPTFMNSLHSSQVASDESNARALYAELQADYLERADGSYVAKPADGTIKVETGDGENVTKITYADGSSITTKTGVVKVYFSYDNGWSVQYTEYKNGEAQPTPMVWGYNATSGWAGLDGSAFTAAGGTGTPTTGGGG